MRPLTLVTGGAGFVGSHLVDALVTRGDDVTVYDRVNPRRSDCRYVSKLSSRVLQGFEVVYHLAANASVRGGTARPTVDLEENLLKTSELLFKMRFAGVKRIVFASSSAVYGNTSVLPTPEDAPMPVQTSMYAASKVGAEALISAYAHGFGMQATIFRFAPMLGERYRRGHVYDFWRKLKANPRRIEVLGDGQQAKAYVYVKDAMRAVLMAEEGIEAPGVRIYNVGGQEPVTVDQSLDWICAEMGVSPERVYTGQSWAGDKACTWLDTTRIKTTGWVPMVSLRDAIVRTVRSFNE